MRILFLSRWFPFPPNNGSKLRIFNLIRGLAEEHELTLISFVEPGDDSMGIEGMFPYCKAVKTIQRRPFDPDSMRSLMGYISPTPRSVVDTYMAEMEASIKQALSETRYDIIIASQFDMAIYHRSFGAVPALFEEAEVSVYYDDYARAASSWERFRYGLTWLKYRRYMRGLMRNFQACTVASHQEAELVRKYISGNQPVDVLPNCVNLPAYAQVNEAPQKDALIFTGSFRYEPNYEAMVWFVSRVYPQIQKGHPHVRLTITGDHAGYPLPGSEGIHLTGQVEDVKPLLARSRVSLVPIHKGGGTRLKILEAMALRVPVVSTSKGAEGLNVQDGEHILIADTPKAFCEAVLRLLEDDVLHQYIASQAYQLVREKYNWEIVLPRFLELVSRAAKQELAVNPAPQSIPVG